MLTARLTGVNWIDSFALGALMNTRGLIALNIGYDLGILSPRIFAMPGHNRPDGPSPQPR